MNFAVIIDHEFTLS